MPHFSPGCGSVQCSTVAALGGFNAAVYVSAPHNSTQLWNTDPDLWNAAAYTWN